MPKSNRNFPDDPTPPWQERDKAPMHGPTSTDGGSLETPPIAGKQPMAEDRGEEWFRFGDLRALGHGEGFLLRLTDWPQARGLFLIAPERPPPQSGYSLPQTTADLGLHFFGVALKLERGRIAIEDNG